ncbi:MAG: hypothetical protein AAGD96_23375 [Chloroflexota bacterium]
MSLKIPALRIDGKILKEESAGKQINALRIDQVLPPKGQLPPAGSDRLYLRFGFVFRGTEKPLIPSFLIDDHGNENHRLRLMEWVYQQGDIYPRSEIFGYEVNEAREWIETQIFVRELELSLRFYCWVVDDLKAPPSGLTVHRFAVIDEKIDEPKKIPKPDDWVLPLRRSRPACWAYPSG